MNQSANLGGILGMNDEIYFQGPSNSHAANAIGNTSPTSRMTGMSDKCSQNPIPDSPTQIVNDNVLYHSLSWVGKLKQVCGHCHSMVSHSCD
jgi:hypothetical protein